MSIDNALLEDASSSHRIYIADSIGCLRVAQCDPPSALPKDYAGPSVKPLILPNFKSHSDHAVQRIASGVLGSDTYVVALARKNATIDVVHIVNQSLPSTSTAPAPVSELRASILCTINETKMKAGIHRFIGLAVSKQGVCSVTSSGIFRYTPIAVVGNVAELGEAKVIDHLPSPLQHASFHPASDPSHFCYGGEDIPLSLWHVPTAVSEQPADSVADMSVESIKTEDLSGLNSKQRKRKRQLEAKSKARELLWGEVWRAKNLPNDNLSLPRRANITATCILNLDESTAEDAETGTTGEETFIAVGTKDGLVRIFQPGAGSRRHVREIRVVPSGQGAVKTLCASSAALNGQKGGLLFVGDTGSKLYAVDWQSGAVVYAYKGAGQIGATLDMAVLPQPAKRSEAEALVTVSSDSLVRLHTTVPAERAVPKAGMSAEKGEVVWAKMIAEATSQSVHAVATAVVWDGVMPLKMGRRQVVGEEEEEEDEVWAGMQEVNDKKVTNGNVGRDYEESTDDDDEDEDDEDEEEEQTEVVQSKASNGQVRRGKTKPAQTKKSRK
ncbi:Ribosome biogenesis protein NSA1 [Pseudozyma hubeiensis]|nr:Ribosome biogenesis protein NSA1 [Pseudozyma hubeiensis]